MPKTKSRAAAASTQRKQALFLDLETALFDMSVNGAGETGPQNKFVTRAIAATENQHPDWSFTNGSFDG